MCPANVRSVDEFVPDERLDRSFLEDSLTSKIKVSQPAHSATLDSDSDGEGRGNPMVSGFQDELDPDDQAPGRLPDRALQTPHVLDLDSEPELKKPVISTTKPKATAIKGSEPEVQDPVPVFLSLTPTAEQPVSRRQGRKKEEDSDPETPGGLPMLSFVMDHPDFESDASDAPQVTQEVFPVRADLLSDLSDDEVWPAKGAESLKPAIISFKHKNDSDLFGLGLQEEPATAKDSSEEQGGE